MKRHSRILVIIILFFVISPIFINIDRQETNKLNTSATSVEGLDFHVMDQIGDRGNEVIIQQRGPDIYAFVAVDTRGIRIYDVSDPENIMFMCEYTNYTDTCIDIAISGNYLYAAIGSDELHVIDISDIHTNATFVTSYSVGESLNCVTVSGDQLFLGYYFPYGIMRILDITNPASPVLIGLWNETGSINDIDVVNDLAYISDYDDGIEILDISNLGSIHEIANHAGNLYFKLVIQENYAYIAKYANLGGDRLEVLDISNPYNPIEVGNATFGDSTSTHDIWVEDNIAYLAAYRDGIVAYDISDKSNPVYLGSFDTGDDIKYGIKYYDSFLYVVGQDNGLEVVKVTENERSITITKPDDFSRWIAGNSYLIKWNSTGDIETVNIQLYKNHLLDLVVASSTPNDGEFLWTLPDYMENHTRYQIRLYAGISDISHYFEIVTLPDSPTYPEDDPKLLVFTSPTSSDVFESGESHEITWTTEGSVDYVKLELYRDGVFLRTITTGIENDESHFWLIPTDLTNSTTYQLKIIDLTDSTTFAYSDNFEVHVDPEPLPDPEPESEPKNVPGFPILAILGSIMIASIVIIHKFKRKK